MRIPPARRNPNRPEIPTTFHRQSETARLLAKLQKQWKLSALFAVAVFFSSVGATYLTKPIYQPTASLEIDPPGAELYNTQNAESSGASEEYLGTEVKNLQSDELAIAVIRQLRLDQNADMIPPAGRLPVDTVVPPSSALRLTPAEYAALDTFRRRIKVERDATSRIVSVSFASHDPVLAATVTNNLLTTFIEMTYERRRASIVQLSAWLEKQLEDVKGNLDRSAKALAEFQRATGIADVDGEKNTVSEQMSELGRQETQAESERIQLESLLENLTQPEALAEVHNSPVVQDLSRRLAENQAELQKAQVIYGENHPEVRKLQSEARELENQLAEQTDSVVRRLQASREAAESRQQAISKEMKVAAGQLSRVARYNALKKDVEANTTLCNDLYRRIKEAGISAGARSTDMEIVDQARVLDHPTRPDWMLNLAGGLFAGILGGVLIGLFRESLDTRINAPEDLRGLPASTGFSFIPVLGSNLGVRQRTLVRKESGPQLYLQERPHSPEAEALRSLKTSILFACTEGNYRVLLVTSSLPHEGKSTLAINLATALSQHGKTCLVDADLRKPCLAQIFNLDSAGGLSHVLSGSGTLTAHEVSPNLMVVPAGKVAGDVSPGELLSPQAMTPLIEELRSQFQFVVLDSSPLLSFAEGRVLARLADGIVFVCRYGVTTKEALSRSEEILNAGNGPPILEIVVNGSRTGLQDYSYYLNPA